MTEKAEDDILMKRAETEAAGKAVYSVQYMPVCVCVCVFVDFMYKCACAQTWTHKNTHEITNHT